MLGGVTRHMLPHLSGVPHFHVNRPLETELYRLYHYTTVDSSENDAFVLHYL